MSKVPKYDRQFTYTKFSSGDTGTCVAHAYESEPHPGDQGMNITFFNVGDGGKKEIVEKVEGVISVDDGVPVKK